MQKLGQLKANCLEYAAASRRLLEAYAQMRGRERSDSSSSRRGADDKRMRRALASAMGAQREAALRFANSVDAENFVAKFEQLDSSFANSLEDLSSILASRKSHGGEAAWGNLMVRLDSLQRGLMQGQER
eukprot:TRINITY_DN4767_c0_g1_i2.p1 TRINITY_DN4767_c0_g1~~TRINITY_DN4767_c0_g1_i2.p1  ORF type:complete len:130 (-),score=24.78 TRINITY_DN4767_c0_g1_i2:400-789(-)